MLDESDDLIKVNTEELTKNYTNVLINQCAQITSQLTEIDPKFLHLITIQATYDAFKHQVAQLNDIETQQQILKTIEFDANNLVYPVTPTVDFVGNA
jgi:hypothetical protein